MQHCHAGHCTGKHGVSGSGSAILVPCVCARCGGWRQQRQWQRQQWRRAQHSAGPHPGQQMQARVPACKGGTHPAASWQQLQLVSSGMLAAAAAGLQRHAGSSCSWSPAACWQQLQLVSSSMLAARVTPQVHGEWRKSWAAAAGSWGGGPAAAGGSRGCAAPGGGLLQAQDLRGVGWSVGSRGWVNVVRALKHSPACAGVAGAAADAATGGC
jgi:hypothetical protein